MHAISYLLKLQIDHVILDGHRQVCKNRLLTLIYLKNNKMTKICVIPVHQSCYDYTAGSVIQGRVGGGKQINNFVEGDHYLLEWGKTHFNNLVEEGRV